MQEKNDFEQLYYDLLYENKTIKKENELLKQEVDVYKRFSKVGNKELISALIEYLRTKDK